MNIAKDSRKLSDSYFLSRSATSAAICSRDSEISGLSANVLITPNEKEVSYRHRGRAVLEVKRF